MYNVMDVLSHGLSVARTRVNVLASNLANAETTRTPDGGPYRRKDIVQMAKSSPHSFQNALDRMTLAKPTVAAVVEDQKAPRMVHQPGHPDANTDGFVAYPNINVVTTMTDLMTASRLYEANVSALQTTRQMLRSASQISIRF